MAEVMKLKSVIDYLNSLVWDGTPRIDQWLVDCAGAADTAPVRAAGRALLVAAVRRARHPGCKYDQMPVIEGPQGCGKSSALRVLAIDDAWYTDELPITSEDVRRIIEVTEGKWIVEAAELQSLLACSPADADRSAVIKTFLSRTHDEARLAYQRERTRVPRGFVVVGTTAADTYLWATGSRRFRSVSVQRFDLARLAEVRDQLWAEAAVAEVAGESIVLAPAEYAE